MAASRNSAAVAAYSAIIAIAPILTVTLRANVSVHKLLIVSISTVLPRSSDMAKGVEEMP